MGVAAQHTSKEWTTGTQYHFMSLDLFILTSNGNIKEVLIISKFSESTADVALKFIPPKTELLICHVQHAVSFKA